MSTDRLTTLLLLVLALGLVACPIRRGGGGGGDDDDSTSGSDDDDDDDATDDDDVGEDCDNEGETQCSGLDFLICNSGNWELVETCSSPTPICHATLGCLACSPGSEFCDDDTVVECSEDGMSTDVVEECDADEACTGGECFGACETAEAQLSYLGCHFMAVSTVNMWLTPGFESDFGVVIGNPDSAPAEVTVKRGTAVVATAVVPAGSTQAIELAYDATLMMTYMTSTTVPDGAYEIETNVPVAAYQYNPLHYISTGGANSYTNDASLMLPEHVLTGSYMVGTFPAWGSDFTGDWAPSFAAIVGTVDGTQVTFNSSTNTAGGTPGALTPGGSTTFTLNRGDVAQIVSYQPSSFGSSHCSANGWPSSGACWALDADLTGSTVTSDQPIAMYAGHGCTYIPYNEFACDHVEEAMLPTETWGTQVVMSGVALPSGTGVGASVFRVMALLDGTTVSFDPAVASSTTLNSGEHMEFTTSDDFVVNASSRIFVWQGIHGSQANGSQTDGDPAMGSGIPQIQWRERYDFLVPDSYETNFVNVVVPTGTGIQLDGSPVSGWYPIGASADFSVARVPLSPGSHLIESPSGVGFSLTAYGYADFTSYLYPGGMNLTR